MPLPFKSLFKKEKHPEVADDKPEYLDIERCERLTAVILGLREKKGLSDDEIINLFFSTFSVTLTNAPDGSGPIISESRTRSFEEIVSHFESYVDSNYYDHGAFNRALLDGIISARETERYPSLEFNRALLNRTTSEREGEEKSSGPTIRNGRDAAVMHFIAFFGSVLVGLFFWPFLLLAAFFLFLFFFCQIANFDLASDGKKVEGFGILDGLPIGCAIPIAFIAVVLFIFAMCR